MNNFVATIDLGTNTFHLLIAEIQPSKNFSIIYRERIPVMIGQGSINQGFITPEAEERALAALTKFRLKLEDHQVPIDRVHCTATSAFRNAKNGQTLVAKIKQKTGIVVNVISGDQEAKYIYYGVRQAIALSSENSLIMDIGGGSVEFILCNQEQILWKQSFEIGAQRLLDRFDIQDPITEDNIQALKGYFSEKLVPLSAIVERHRPKILVGASGTFDTLSEIYQHRDTIQVEAGATELPLTQAAFQRMLQDFSRLNRAQRLAIPGMIEMRVDMIVPAAWLIQYALETYQIHTIQISSYALKEGLVTQLAQRFS
ncbi:Ppx/GppA phosphatase family protein [Tunicatimonas pelagia]|uniref:Ppx/GppA phosphatase family protein n=1 Tax=Tunicatimonas pelagia TaxID=931531 RepID=UPI0026668D2E|nr:exopolyphosphatase [Tunicatimonas pelagia]WKN42286.1 exopolyphosphatase [Tunicatimonas pelagia]